MQKVLGAIFNWRYIVRMHKCNPVLLCRSHLLGEHNEIHKHRHIFVKGYSIEKRILDNAIEPMCMKIRHDQLAKEIDRRARVISKRSGHNSPFVQPSLDLYSKKFRNYKMDKTASILWLIFNCTLCRKRIFTLTNLIKKGTR